MKFKKRKILLFIVGCLLLVYASFCVWLFKNQEKLLFHPQSVSAETVYNFATPFDEIWIPVGDKKLHGLYFKAKEPKGLIIFFHGNTQMASEYGDTANEFTDQGFDYFVPDYRGFGKSTGSILNEKQFLEDADAVWEWATKKYSQEKIALAGRSMGSVPAAYLAAKNKPRLTVLISPFYNIDAMARIRYPLMPKFLVRYKFRNDLWVAQTQSPIYFVHGTKDQTIPYSHSEMLAAAAKVPDHFYAVRGAKHGDLQNFPKYHKILYDLMNDKVDEIRK